MIEDQLQGLIIPSEKAVFNNELWIGVALLCCLLAYIIYRLQKARQSPLSVAKRKLADLAHSQPQSAKNDQTTALALTSILCKGFCVKRLDQVCQTNKKDWDVFQNELNSACYAKNAGGDINRLLTEAQQWLTTP